MVQWGILLVVVVMKRNKKIVVPSILGGFVVESATRYAYYCIECNNLHVLADIVNAYFLNLK